MHLPWRGMCFGPGDGSVPDIQTSVLPEEMEALGQLAANRNVLEIGSAFGYTCIGMALANARHVTAVDPHIWLQSFPVITGNVAAYDVAHKVTIEQGYAAAHEGTGYDLVFIDGDHSYEAVLQDLALASRVLTPGGVIACHDYGEDCCCPGVRQAIDEVYGTRGQVVAGTLWTVQL